MIIHILEVNPSFIVFRRITDFVTRRTLLNHQLTKYPLKVNGFYDYEFDELIKLKIREISDISEVEDYLSTLELFSLAWPNVKEPFDVITEQVKDFKINQIKELKLKFDKEVKEINSLKDYHITPFIVNEWVSDAKRKLMV